MTLERWLSIQDWEENTYNFAVQRVSEACDPDNDIVGFLAHEILVAHINPQMLKDDCESLLQDIRYLCLDVVEEFFQEEVNTLRQEWPDIERAAFNGYLNSEVLPDLEKGRNALITRIGNFGEILMAKYLVVFENFWFPIYKLRLREKKDWAARLTDLCLLKRVEGHDKSLICYSEVKTHSSQCNKNLGIEGHESLAKDDALDDPEVLRFIKVWMSEIGEYEKARFFSDLKAGRIQCDKCYELHLIHDANTWDDIILSNLNEHGLDDRLSKFSVRVFLINNLRRLIDTAYEHTWISAREIVNE